MSPCGLAQAPSVLTLPALRQEVQTLTRLLVPLITVRTDWMFGFQRRECRRCEWDTLLPKRGLLAQMSHVEAATVVSWYVDVLIAVPAPPPRRAAGSVTWVSTEVWAPGGQGNHGIIAQ